MDKFEKEVADRLFYQLIGDDELNRLAHQKGSSAGRAPGTINNKDDGSDTYWDVHALVMNRIIEAVVERLRTGKFITK